MVSETGTECPVVNTPKGIRDDHETCQPVGQKILIVEDELIFAEDLQEILTGCGYEVCGCVPTGEEALAKIPELLPDLVLIDIVLAGRMNGIELGGAIHAIADIPFIYLTSNSEEDTIASAKCTRPYGYIPKPFDQRVLFSTIEIALYKHQADRQVRESENRYRTFVENIQGIAYRYNCSRALEFFHGAVEKISGYPAADFTGGRIAWADLIHPDDRGDSSFLVVNDGTLYPKNQSREYRIVRKDGGIRWIHDQTRILYQFAWSGPLTEGLIYDITPLKILEADLKKSCDIRTIILLTSGHFFRRFLQKMNSRPGPDDHPALLSSLSEILGGVGYEMDLPVVLLFEREVSPENLIHISEKLRCVHPKYVPPSDISGIGNLPYTDNGFSRWDDQLQKGYPVFGTISHFPLSEQAFFLNNSVSSVIAVPVFCKDRFWGFILGAHFADAHEWTEYEISSMQITADVIATILESGRLSGTEIPFPGVPTGTPGYAHPPPDMLMDAAVDIVFIADYEGKILHMNRAGLEFFGIDNDSGRREPSYSVFEAFISENVIRLSSPPPVPQKGDPLELGLSIGEKSVFFDLSLSPVSGSPESRRLYMGIARDITRQRTLQRKQREIHKKLQLMQKIFRHDLNNQITAIFGYLSLLKRETSNPAFLGFIQKEEKIVESIQKSMGFTKIYENLGDESAVWIDISEVFSSAWASLEQETVQLDLPGKPLEICVDPLFRNVVFNLLDNTLRHGGKELSLIRVSFAPSEKQVVIRYEDNGVGIAGENKEKIFNRGFYKNNGFGLLLSREILSLTGLSIRETGIYGNGACFEITVPVGMWRYKEPEV
ncbi:MAG: response regulator [Methanoregula sp.]